MLNIEVQMCGLVLTLLLIFFSMRHERTGLYSEHLFHISLIVSLCCIVLDILSVIGISYQAFVPTWLTVLLCKLYLVSLLTASYMGFVYSYSDVKKLRNSKVLLISQVFLEILGDTLIMVLPVYYYGNGRAVYSYGPAASCTFIFCPMFIFGALLITFIYGKKINPHRKRAVQAWMVIELIAAGIQFLKPELLLVGFGETVGMIILYAELENPDAILDRVTGAFSHSVLRDYLQQLYDNHRSFSCLFVCTESEWRLDIGLENQILLDMVKFFGETTDAKLFRGTGNDFVLVYIDSAGQDAEMRSRTDITTIERRFKRTWEGENRIDMSLMYLPKHSIVDAADELLAIYHYQRAELNEGAGELVILGAHAAESIREFKTVHREIMQAVSDDRIEVFYQPIYSFEHDSFVSAEALARLRDSDGNIMMPGRFIPVAEESGMIESIGECVLEKTCIALKEGNLRELGTDYIEVNLSVAQCENTKLASIYSEIMDRHGLQKNLINLEITESAVLNMKNILMENMRELKEKGCTFSLDDFGTGESNLNYIVDMPVDIVKFDRSMVQKYFSSERAKIVMTASVNMVKQLGYKIVAEGVESFEQLESMKELGIDFIQGFYFSKPLPYKEFVAFITEKNSRPVLGAALG